MCLGRWGQLLGAKIKMLIYVNHTKVTIKAHLKNLTRHMTKSSGLARNEIGVASDSHGNREQL